MAPQDRPAAKALRLLRQISRRASPRSGPVRLSRRYLRLVAAAEALAENRTLADKSWVERSDATFRAWCRSARLLR